MKKLKKYQRVENYLHKLMLRHDFDLEDLEALHYRDICEVEELEGIGDRTISNILTDFKEKNGLEPQKVQMTKKQRVEEYLSDKLESGEMTVHDLLRLSYNDLKKIKELADVGKTTLTCTLSSFKHSYTNESFENGVLDFLSKDSGTVQPSRSVNRPALVAAKKSQVAVNNSRSVGLASDEIICVKKMIKEYRLGHELNREKSNQELEELIHALQHVGINYKKIIRMYWEDMSKGYGDHHILSQNIPQASNSYQLSSAM